MNSLAGFCFHFSFKKKILTSYALEPTAKRDNQLPKVVLEYPPWQIYIHTHPIYIYTYTKYLKSSEKHRIVNSIA